MSTAQRSLFISCEVDGRAAELGGIIREICQRIDEKDFDTSLYSKDIDSVGIIINCFPEEMMLAGWGKPRKYISYAKRFADIRLPLPYVDFRNADKDTKFLMVTDNIVKSVEVIGERCRKSRKAAFDSESMAEEILRRLGIDRKQLDNINGVMEKLPE